MKKISSILIVIALFLFSAGAVYAANATDTIGADVDGSPICTLSVTTSDLTITSPTGMGPSSTLFTNSPIEMELTDNNVSAVQGQIIMVEATSSEPEQYSDSGEGTYYIGFDLGTWTPSADNEVTPVSPSYDFVQFDEAGGLLSIGTSPTGKILHGTFSVPTYLYIEENKRLYGDTADSITIQFTFVDF